MLSIIVGVAGSLAKSGTFSGWFGGGEEWQDEILGEKYSTEGSVLDELEFYTGREYPYLREQLESVARTHKQIRECWFSAKAKKIKSYQTKLAGFAQGVADEYTASEGGFGALASLPKLFKNPLVLALGMVFLVFVLLLTRTKRR